MNEILKELDTIELSVETLWSGYDIAITANNAETTAYCEDIYTALSDNPEAMLSVESIISRPFKFIWDILVSIYNGIKSLVLRLFNWFKGFFVSEKKDDTKREKATNKATKDAAGNSGSASAGMSIDKSTYDYLTKAAENGDRYARKILDDIKKGKVTIRSPEESTVTLLDYLVRNTGKVPTGTDMLPAYLQGIADMLLQLNKKFMSWDEYNVRYQLALDNFNTQLFNVLRENEQYTDGRAPYYQALESKVGKNSRVWAAMNDLTSVAGKFDWTQFMSKHVSFEIVPKIKWTAESSALSGDKQRDRYANPPGSMADFEKGFIGGKALLNPSYVKQTTIKSILDGKLVSGAMRSAVSRYESIRTNMEAATNTDVPGDSNNWIEGGRWSKRTVTTGSDTTALVLPGRIWEIASKSNAQVISLDLSITMATAKEVSTLVMGIGRIRKLINLEKDEVLKDLREFSKMLKKKANRG